MRFTDFRLPTELGEASKAMKELGASGFLLAGGTSLTFQEGKAERTAVDLARAGLAGIEDAPDGFKIGAMTRIADLQEYRGGRGWVLDRVARLFATQQIRNMATLGGSIVWVTPWADFPVALLVLDSEMTIRGNGERTVSRADFFSSQPSRLFREGDILASVRIKRLTPNSGFGYRKTTRTHADFSVATAAAAIELDGKVIKRVRVAVGAALPFPKRLTEVEKLLSGKALAKDGLGENAFLKMVTDGTKGFEWKGRQGVSDEYAGRLAVVAARDAIAEASMQALGASEAQP